MLGHYRHFVCVYLCIIVYRNVIFDNHMVSILLYHHATYSQKVSPNHTTLKDRLKRTLAEMLTNSYI